jgi:serine/threonine protein kinase
MIPREGTQIAGAIRLIEPLGDGAMGSVWVAQHEGLGKRVAVKLISPELLRDELALKRFNREVMLAGQITTKHVAKSLGHGVTEDGTPYLVMELLEGETLQKHLERAGRLRLGDVVGLLEQLAEALDEAHGLGIVHRDIKPANIFLVEQQGNVVLKMLDFGMAKRTEVMDPSVVTEAGTSVGTPDYMSPEQLRFANEVDHRSDLWALAVLAYRAIVGRLPFTSGSFAGLCMTICNGSYTAPSQIDQRLPRSLDMWFERALNVDRDERYDSAGETVEALREALLLGDTPSWGKVTVVVLLVLLALSVGAAVAWMGV